MVAALIPLIGAVISAIPNLYSAFTTAQTIKTASGTVIDVSKLAKDMLAKYLEVSKEITNIQMKNKLAELDASHISELAQIEAKFQHTMVELGYKVDLAEYELAMKRLTLLETDILHGNWYDRSWRPTLFWGCTILVLTKGLVGLFGGAMLEYLPGMTPFVEHMVSFSIEEYKEIISIALGVGIAARTVEKIRKIK